MSSSSTAHPRSRGENILTVRTSRTETGSSPLTRGKRPCGRIPRGHARLIPAHAGKTQMRSCAASRTAAHPRSRGENWPRSRAAAISSGSSPLTRGKPCLIGNDSDDRGLIPAHAGKTVRRVGPASSVQAHPRSRGENHCMWCVSLPRRGSSPLTRGKRSHWSAQTKRYGLIPAHAGKTRPRGGARLSRGAHPRSRGENRSSVIAATSFMGSSPLTRGKPGGPLLGGNRAGLIPAHAGKTVHHRDCRRCRQAHPRSRGENAQAQKRVIIKHGSSPLTRGKHFLTCAFTAQIDQILETLELAASFGSYLIWVACATDAPQDPVRSIGLVLPSSMGAS